MRELKARYGQAKRGGWIMATVGTVAIVLVIGLIIAPIGYGVLVYA